MRRPWAAWLVLLALAAGCGSSTSSDTSIKKHLLRGVAQIRTTRDRAELHAKLVRTLASLRRDRASTAAERRARTLAIEGFEATLKGVRSQLDFVENDSGNVAAATRDARRADRYLALGASRLRAAGAALGIRIR
jgi:Fic family protein